MNVDERMSAIGLRLRTQSKPHNHHASEQKSWRRGVRVLLKAVLEEGHLLLRPQRQSRTTGTLRATDLGMQCGWLIPVTSPFRKTPEHISLGFLWA